MPAPASAGIAQLDVRFAPKADIDERDCHVRFVPIADIGCFALVATMDVAAGPVTIGAWTGYRFR
jgi:hypothetical protein